MRRSIWLVALAVVLSGCGSRADPVRESAEAAEPPKPVASSLSVVADELPPRVSPPPAPSCSAGEEEAMRTPKRAYAAIGRRTTVAYARPGGRRLATFELRNVNGFPTVFGVLAVVRDETCRPLWYRVQLPVRPNGATGYVSAADVELAVVKTRIEIDLSERRIELYRGGRRVLTATAAVGSSITPTPTGQYYVNQRLLAPDPWGPFGPAALGISAFSPVLQDWVQGGPIAIHGTNDPSSVGKAVSYGCLRVRNEVLEVLFRETPAGTPVLIRA